ncbi:MAG: FixH family protein [Ignavibacteriales bacterium]|nr:MAG: hypothetical protein F9K26_02500 [Ignavibacteriaceae bacterium]MBW7872304.1 FixH family protein [Ignavibacteria bacterium]MCZ2142587.1 FixH family protein [Ignavibacteriales bacterium]OQY72127.1 MAG: hypothetical protein B6D45_09420 [Ignavibacteriales bacterium UTCHB3]MBV6445549.1 hypothetical protein [Ignavibacteriaceae bacterium]
MSKFHWGHGIAIFLVLFTILTISVVVFAFSQKVDLVTDNYYEKELKYEDEIAGLKRGLEYKDSLIITLVKNDLKISYPFAFYGIKASGKIHLYKPDRRVLDQEIAVNYDQAGNQIIDMTNQGRGVWKVTIDLNDGKEDYLFQKRIYLE